jgi:hypothetical protein
MGNDFQKALELSMADGDLRLQKFSGVFSVEVNSKDCQALSAPNLHDMYPQLARGAKRQLHAPPQEDRHSSTSALSGLTASAKKKAKKDRTKAKKLEETKAAARATAAEARAAQQVNRAAGGATRGAKGTKGTGKGTVIGQVPPPPALPQGAKDYTSDNKPLCRNYNKGTCTRTNCRFQHLCWFCEKSHPGSDCTARPS